MWGEISGVSNSSASWPFNARYRSFLSRKRYLIKATLPTLGERGERADPSAPRAGISCQGSGVCSSALLPTRLLRESAGLPPPHLPVLRLSEGRARAGRGTITTALILGYHRPWRRLCMLHLNGHKDWVLILKIKCDCYLEVLKMLESYVNG